MVCGSFPEKQKRGFEVTKEYLAMVENLHGRKVKCLQTDNGGEYTSVEFDKLLKNHGITRRLTIPYNPEQNGIAERNNRTLLDMARCLLMQSGLPTFFWAEAVNTANYIRNRSPSKSLRGKTLLEMWTGKIPDMSYFREFGCRALCLDRKPNRGKFESRTKEGICLGYGEETKGYRVWIPNERKVEITRDVKFFEEPERKMKENMEFLPESFLEDLNLKSQEGFIDVKLNPTSEEEDELSDDNSPNLKRERGRPRINRTGARGRPRKIYKYTSEEANISEIIDEAYMAEVPMKQAMNSADADEWYSAMAIEIKSILKNNTWKLVECPKDQEVIGSRIVLRNKYAADGRLERRKARVVAQGFSQ